MHQFTQDKKAVPIDAPNGELFASKRAQPRAASGTDWIARAKDFKLLIIVVVRWQLTKEC
jgi:hypothetical protein